jgi:hypothetical protein
MAAFSKSSRLNGLFWAIATFRKRPEAVGQWAMRQLSASPSKLALRLPLDLLTL